MYTTQIELVGLSSLRNSGDMCVPTYIRTDWVNPKLS